MTWSQDEVVAFFHEMATEEAGRVVAFVQTLPPEDPRFTTPALWIKEYQGEAPSTPYWK